MDKSWSEALVYVEDKNEILSSKDSHFQEGISAARLELNLKAEAHMAASHGVSGWTISDQRGIEQKLFI